jgi:hypothetical protein
MADGKVEVIDELDADIVEEEGPDEALEDHVDDVVEEVVA